MVNYAGGDPIFEEEDVFEPVDVATGAGGMAQTLNSRERMLMDKMQTPGKTMMGGRRQAMPMPMPRGMSKAPAAPMPMPRGMPRDDLTSASVVYAITSPYVA